MSPLEDAATPGRAGADRPGARERIATRLAFFIAGFAVSAWAPLIPFAKRRLALDDAQLGLMLLCLGIGSVLMMPLAGGLAARFGCRRTILAAGTVICLCLPALMLAPSIPMLAAALAVFGASLGVLALTPTVFRHRREANKQKTTIAALQTEYSLWSREPEEGLFDVTRELGIGFVPYSPLGRGFLSGEFKSIDDLAADDYRRHNPRFQGENFQKNMDLVAAVTAIAADKGVTAAQLALAWVLAQGDDLVPIPGTRRIPTLEDNIAATEIVLTAEDLARIEAVFPKGAASGHRYAEAARAALNR